MPTEVYTVTKAYPGAKLGAEVSLDPADAASHVAEGYLAKKDPAAKAEVESDVDGIVEGMADMLLTKTLAKFNEKARGASPFALTVPAKSAAEPKEAGSFAEWLQCVAFQANTVEHQKAAWGRDRLVNKYQAKVNSNFGREYDDAVRSKAGGFDASGNVEKASVQVESVGALGGFAVPIEYSRELFKLAGDQSLFLSRVKRYTMTGKQLMIPALDYSTGGSGKSPYLGGMNAQWTAENVGFVQQNANLRQIELNANLLAGYTQASRTLLADDQYALQQVMTDLFSKAIAFNTDYAIFLGDGKGKPEGMITSAACKTFQRGTWTTNGALLTDMATADSYLIPEMEGEAIWVLPPSFKKNLYPMTDASGKVVFLANGAPGPEGPAAMRPSMAVFGKNLHWSQLPASSGTTNDVNLVIPSMYAFGLREEIEIGVSEHYAWTTNLLTWRFLFRGDGKSLLNTTLTLQNGDVVAPFVTVTT